MMNKNCLHLLALAILAMGNLSTLHAQQSAAVIRLAKAPAAPLIRTAADGTTWTVEFLEPNKKTPPPEGTQGTAADSDTISKKISNTLSNGVRRVTTETPAGKFTYYMTKGFILYPNLRRKSGKIRVTEAVDENNRGANGKAEVFDDFTWVNAKDFLGVASYRGRNCYVYRQYASSSQPTANKEPQILRTAFIDQESRYPVALEEPSGTLVYRFGSKESFSLPPEYAKALEEYEKVVTNIGVNTKVPQ